VRANAANTAASIKKTSRSFGFASSTSLPGSMAVAIIRIILRCRAIIAMATKFRWRTARLKMKPSNKFIREVVRASGEAILVLGTRKAESANRAANMAGHFVEFDVLSRRNINSTRMIALYRLKSATLCVGMRGIP
jgi:hypothetical protein